MIPYSTASGKEKVAKNITCLLVHQSHTSDKEGKGFANAKVMTSQGIIYCSKFV